MKNVSFSKKINAAQTEVKDASTKATIDAYSKIYSFTKESLIEIMGNSNDVIFIEYRNKGDLREQITKLDTTIFEEQIDEILSFA